MEEQIQAIIDSIVQRLCKLEHDVSELFKRTNVSNVWQAKYGEKIDTIEKNVEKLTKLVEKLTEAPGKRWESIITVIITAIVTGVIAFFMGKIIGK